MATPASSARKRAPGSGHIRVVIRVRPLSNAELYTTSGAVEPLRYPTSQSIEIDDESVSEKAFTFDRVFDPSSSQSDVFDFVAKPIVEDVMQGYNGTIFAYGQTGSGKTHTMEGQIADEQLAGVIPRTVAEIFRVVEAADDNLVFTIKVSYIEVYMEKIRDLLDANGVRTNLQVREDKLRGVYVSGATEQYVTCEEELLGTLASGAKNRAVAATGMNSGSSRSHSVFLVSVQQSEVSSSSTKTGTLFLVDLAGSEMVKKTHASGQVLEEAKTINKSLSALGQVINALTDGKTAHVPYRDSKLTRVLQNSLGGNSKTCLIVCCSPSAYNQAETVSSLRFGSRAKRIKNQAVVNETRSADELAMLLAKAEIVIEMKEGKIAALEAQLSEWRTVHPELVGESCGGGGGGGGGGGSGSVGRPESLREVVADSSSDAAADAFNAAKDEGYEDYGSIGAAGGGAVGGRGREARSNSGGAAGVREGSIGGGSGGGAEEAAAVIERLTARLSELEAELDEERSERKRRAREAETLEALLKQREATVAAAERRAEAQCASASAAESAAEQRAADTASELERMRELEEQAVFNFQEATFTIERLTLENRRLVEEARELTHDAVSPANVRRLPPQLPASAPSSQGATAATTRADGDAAVAEAGAAAATAAAVAAAAAAAAAGAAAAGPLPAELEGMLIPEAREYLRGRVAALAAERAALMAAVERGGRDAAAMRRDCERRIADTEEQRAQLAADVQRSEERAMELREQIERRGAPVGAAAAVAAAAGTEGAAAASSAEAGDGDNATDRHGAAMAAAVAAAETERERHRRQLKLVQQRLEQLVAVHRQLLRKFAQLELENGDACRKISLRDERIRQLEGNARQLAANLRAQSERHTGELGKVRAEVLTLREEYDRQQAAVPLPQPPLLLWQQPRTVRGGGAARGHEEIRVVRGGGGRAAAAAAVAAASAAPTSPTLPPDCQDNRRGSLLGRLFGGGRK
ncbi:unnamed protein product [Phaeothamnion confervicola]